MTPQEALRFAGENPNCDIGKYQKIACQDSKWAYYFALDIDCANIEYCQKYACQDPYWANRFVELVREADIEYCYNFTNYNRKKYIERFILEVL